VFVVPVPVPVFVIYVAISDSLTDFVGLLLVLSMSVITNKSSADKLESGKLG
jgi:hypothetical protein